jgi:hypothetical protein
MARDKKITASVTIIKGIHRVIAIDQIGQSWIHTNEFSVKSKAMDFAGVIHKAGGMIDISKDCWVAMKQGTCLVFDIKQFDRDKTTGTLVSEISDLGVKRLCNEIRVEDGLKVRTFKFVGTDENEGDVAGWNYKEEGAAVRMLIIND